MPPKQIRKVVEHESFKKALKQIYPKFQRAEQLVSGAKWVLARDPQYGHQINKTVWLLALAPAPEFPQVGIFYCFNDTHVLLIWMDLHEQGHIQNGESELDCD